jgi:cytochrome c-type biogenesis protein CcmH/NrfG
VLQKEGEELIASLPTNRVMLRDELYTTGRTLMEVALSDPAPAYRSKWDLGNDANLEKGVIYMAGLNPKEPACWVMLGILAAKNSDKNLTIAAYRKALTLSSPQAPLLRSQIELLRDHITKSRQDRSGKKNNFIGSVVLVLLVAGLIVLAGRFLQRMLSPRSAKAENQTEE